ncbi:ATP-binding protein [Sphingomonas sp.]|uniref:sensor histidine kinase n=1 Tax=Sphingomonas sp. TaxID=28214 RepID=UPI0025EA74C2|nr:ATP-binding protein [Sphingomonas sp.]
MPFVELGTILGLAVIATITSLVLTGGVPGQKLLTPPFVALLLVANLVPSIALLVLIGRRVAKGRARRSPVGGGGKLHVRLVGIFSLLASVPMLLVVIFASLLFQYGVSFWFSDHARGTLEGAAEVAKQSYAREEDRVSRNSVAMSGDLADALGKVSMDNPQFGYYLVGQLAQRELTEGMILRAQPGKEIASLALVNPYDREIGKFITSNMVNAVRSGKMSVVVESPNGIGALTKLPIGTDNYLYAARIDPTYGSQIQRARIVLRDYRDLLERSRKLQLQFNAALFIIALLIVALAVWIALTVADRLVRPVGELVDAARRVAAGDLTARVTTPRTHDEVGTLANAFNRMTGRLEAQTGDLERRRALIEAVLSGVTAGVVSVDAERSIRLLNVSAKTLLSTGDTSAIGRKLFDIAPELDGMLGRGEREGIIQLTSGSEPRTLAAKIVADEGGHVLTFDDITEQLLDQRRAAWSDVARRIAHEIKNPLTPIQLAAERLKRRYAKEITSDPATFIRLTETIVRQVGDLRRMVDEFSSFARMPKPVFRQESLLDIARQSLFLHEVAHPTIKFDLVAGDDAPNMVCDRRQLGQALTNVVKNAVEAIQQQPDGEEAGGTVTLTLSQAGDIVRISVADSGIGLPPERGRLVEPYMTTRAGGTGLGLAIVKKIVEEHFGTMNFADQIGGGTIVSMDFDTVLLEPLRQDGEPVECSDDPVPTELLRTGRS